MDCSSHGLNTNRTTGNWHQAGCTGSCILQKWHWQVWLVSIKYRQKWHWQVWLVSIKYRQTFTGPVPLGQHEGKTVRDRYGQNGTVAHTVRALYGARRGRGTWPASFPVCSPYGQRTGPLWVPVPPVVGTAPTMPVRACLLGLILLIVSSGALFITWMANRTIKYTHHLQNHKNIDKTRTIFSIVKPGTQTRHTYTFKIKGSCCCYYH